MSCERNILVHRYFDGELSETQRREVEAHLAECGECGAMLGSLEQMSSRLRAAGLGAMRVGEMDRIKRMWGGERGVLRIAEWMTAAAAAILVGAVLTWPSESSEAVAATAPPVWQTVAVLPPENAHDETLVDAQWMTDELSVNASGGVERK